MLTTLAPDGLRMLIDAIGAPVFVVAVEDDGGFRFVAVNGRLEDLVGVTDAALRDRRIDQALPADVAARLGRRLTDCVAAGQAYDYDGYIENDGVRWLKVSLTPLLDDAGRVVRIMGVPLDVTDTRMAEDRLHRAAEAGGVAVWEWTLGPDAGGGLLKQVNLAPLLGLADDAATEAAAWLGAMTEEARARLTPMIEAAIAAGGGIVTMDFQQPTPDGPRHLLGRGRVCVDGGTVRIVGSTVDVTERQALTRALTAERTIFRELAQLSSDWFWMTDENDRFVPFPAVGEGDGVAVLQAEGLSRRDLLDPRLPAEDMAEIEAAVAARRPFRDLVYPQRRADGTTSTVSISGNPRFDEAGRYLGYIGVCTDITARRNWMKLQYGRQKMEALGQMAGGLAHELNNLLHPVIAFATRARRMVGDESPAAPLLEDIATSGRAARDIVRGVLTFSRHDRAEQRPIVLADAVCRAVDFAVGVLPREARVVRSIEPLPDTAAVRAADVAQVVMNLVSNALDATGGGGTLTVGLRRAQVPGDAAAEARGLARGAYAVLRIADDGCGMDAAVIGSIFDPFFTTKPVGEGTGLGLSVVYGIARGWGGDVAVTSAPGEGAAFEVFVPLVAEAASSQQRQTRDMAV